MFVKESQHIVVRHADCSMSPQEDRSMKTGRDVIESGLYVTECCGEEVQLEKDGTFPRCVRCMGLTRWELVELQDQVAA